MLTQIIPLVEELNNSSKKDLAGKINGNSCHIWKCNRVTMHAPRIIERISYYYLIVDEISGEGWYYIQSPSGELYYIIINL